MRYGFINNFAQALSGELAQGATSMTLDDNGALLDNASAEMVYTLTLFDVTSGENEIVHVTAASGNDLTVERGKEGTTDRAWPTGTQVEMRLTAGAAQSFDYTLPGETVALGASSEASVEQGVAVGEETKLESDNSVAVGYNASVGDGCDKASSFGYRAQVGFDAEQALALGSDSYVASNNSMAIGPNSSADWGDSCIAIGNWAYSGGSGGKATAIGDSASALAKRAIALGFVATADGEESICLGAGAESNVVGGLRIHGLSYLPAEASAGIGNNDVPYQSANSVQRTASLTAIATDAVNLADPGDSYTLDLPDNTLFLIDAIDIVIVEADGAGGDPEIVIGPDDQDPDAYLAATPVTKTIVGGRETHDPLVSDGVTSLRVAVDTAGTGTYKAKIVFRGYVMEV